MKISSATKFQSGRGYKLMGQQWSDIYTNGSFLNVNPNWDVEVSPWKARYILKIIERNKLCPRTVCEVGCGAGEILAQLQKKMPDCMFCGYEISPQAFKLCQPRENDTLHFKLKDILQEEDVFFDIIMLIDVIEHIEDYFNFLRKIRQKSKYKIVHFPLDLSVQSILRRKPIIKVREVGHIHYFTKELAIQILKECGYEIIDYFYTPSVIELPAKSFKSYLMRLPRRLLYAIHKDLAVRILGGYSLLILLR